MAFDNQNELFWEELFNKKLSLFEYDNLTEFFTFYNATLEAIYMVTPKTESLFLLNNYLNINVYKKPFILRGVYKTQFKQIQFELNELKELFFIIIKDRSLDKLPYDWLKTFIKAIISNADFIFTLYNLPLLLHVLWSSSKFLFCTGSYNLAFKIFRLFASKINGVDRETLELMWKEFNLFDDNDSNKILYIDQLWKLTFLNYPFFVDKYDINWKIAYGIDTQSILSKFNQEYLDIHFKVSQELMNYHPHKMIVAVLSYEYFVNKLESYGFYNETNLSLHFVRVNAPKIVEDLFYFLDRFGVDDRQGAEFAIYYLVRLQDLDPYYKFLPTMATRFNIFSDPWASMFGIFNDVIMAGHKKVYPAIFDEQYLNMTTTQALKLIKQLQLRHKQNLAQPQPAIFANITSPNLNRFIGREVIKGTIGISSPKNTTVNAEEVIKNFDRKFQQNEKLLYLVPDEYVSEIQTILTDVIDDHNSFFAKPKNDLPTPNQVVNNIYMNINDERANVNYDNVQYRAAQEGVVNVEFRPQIGKPYVKPVILTDVLDEKKIQSPLQENIYQNNSQPYGYQNNDLDDIYENANFEIAPADESMDLSYDSFNQPTNYFNNKEVNQSSVLDDTSDETLDIEDPNDNW